MFSGRTPFVVSLLALAVLASSGCTSKRDESATADTASPSIAPAPAAMDTAMKMDTTVVLRMDSAIVSRMDTVSPRHVTRGPPPPTRGSEEGRRIQKRIDSLRVASISFQTPDTLFIGKPELVTVTIDPQLPPKDTGRPAGIRPDTTHVAPITEVCLSAPGFKVEDQAGAENKCREQVVSFTRPSYWSWNVTALPEIKESGPRPIDVTVNALLGEYPKYTVFTSHHKAYVHVDQPGLLQRMVSALDPWKALLLSIAAIAGVLTQGVRWLKSRRKEG